MLFPKGGAKVGFNFGMQIADFGFNFGEFRFAPV
jgi:hypothetical protein